MRLQPAPRNRPGLRGLHSNTLATLPLASGCSCCQGPATTWAVTGLLCTPPPPLTPASAPTSLLQFTRPTPSRTRPRSSTCARYHRYTSRHKRGGLASHIHHTCLQPVHQPRITSYTIIVGVSHGTGQQEACMAHPAVAQILHQQPRCKPHPCQGSNHNIKRRTSNQRAHTNC